VKEEHGRGFPRERGRRAATNTAVGPGGRARERETGEWNGVGEARERERGEGGRGVQAAAVA